MKRNWKLETGNSRNLHRRQVSSFKFRVSSCCAAVLLTTTALLHDAAAQQYPIVDTGQTACYGAHTSISPPSRGRPFYGQDAQYDGLQPSYRDNRDGTVSDLNTGLMWVKDPGEKVTYDQAVAGAARCRVGGYKDWRLPTTKELYSLILFSGSDVGPGMGTSDCKPFIDDVFVFTYGKAEDGDRLIDSQFATCTIYTGSVMDGRTAMFGVNFADGRIKGYPTGPSPRHRSGKTFYVLYVRGNPDYGKNDFVDHHDGTITDKATGLMWQKADSGKGMNWEDALEYAEDLKLAGHGDWRLPNAKELQSIVDYSRSPDATGSAAIDPVFDVTPIRNELGQTDYACYWTGTTHQGGRSRGSDAVYVAFGRGMGQMRNRWMDVHGAGCQRSDPKDANANRFMNSRGPQGDAVRVLNYVRCVRDAE